MKNVEIQLSDKAIKELYELKKKLNPPKGHPWHEEIPPYEEYYKKMKEEKLGALFG